MDRHRQNNYWEPTYSPESEPLTEKIDWTGIEGNNGPRGKICDGSQLPAGLTRFDEKQFRDCDFIGTFSNCRQIVFAKCIFNGCHFGHSTWEKVKFSNCEFKECSFGVSRFKLVQFIECKFEKIYFSGNETQFDRCLINPKQFISSGWTNLDKDVLATKHTSPGYQRRRFERTKAKAAKAILNSLKPLNDDGLFYLAVQVSVVQAILATIAETKDLIATKSAVRGIPQRIALPLYYFELVCIILYGHLAGWGNSVLRPLLFGICSALVFGSIYALSTDASFGVGVMRAIDVQLLAGYTKFPIINEPLWLNYVYFTNMLFGVIWYSIMFPVLLNRTVFQRS